MLVDASALAGGGLVCVPASTCGAGAGGAGAGGAGAGGAGATCPSSTSLLSGFSFLLLKPSAARVPEIPEARLRPFTAVVR